eukprot:COSAG02_NODE_971_length_15551_cov_4.415157_18_plen_63_part_00
MTFLHSVYPGCMLQALIMALVAGISVSMTATSTLAQCIGSPFHRFSMMCKASWIHKLGNVVD